MDNQLRKQEKTHDEDHENRWHKPVLHWKYYSKLKEYCFGGARGVMVSVVRNGHGHTSSNPGRDWLHFT